MVREAAAAGERSTRCELPPTPLRRRALEKVAIGHNDWAIRPEAVLGSRRRERPPRLAQFNTSSTSKRYLCGIHQNLEA